MDLSTSDTIQWTDVFDDTYDITVADDGTNTTIMFEEASEVKHSIELVNITGSYTSLDDLTIAGYNFEIIS